MRLCASELVGLLEGLGWHAVVQMNSGEAS